MVTRLSELLRDNGLDVILSTYPDAIYAFNLDGSFLDFNDALCVMTGYSREELLVGTYENLIDPSHLEITREHFAAAIAGDTRRYRSRGMRKSGEIYDVDVTNMPVRGPDGQIIAIGGLAHDNSEEIHASERASATESMAKIAARMARLAGWSIDAKTETIEWSEELFKILGVEVSAPLSLEHSLLQYEGDASTRMSEVVRQCLTTGEPFDEVTKIRTGSGDVWNVRVIGEAVRDDEGNIVRVVGALYDITTLVRQRREVARLEQRMTEVMNGVQSALLFVNRQWIIEWGNDAACELLGRSHDELDGAYVHELFPNFSQAHSYPAFVRAMDEGIYSANTVFNTLRQKYFEVHVLPTPDGIVASLRDVTAEEEVKLKAAEDATRADLLAQMVDRSKEAMIIRDFVNGVTYWNKSAEELYGWTLEEVRERPLIDLLYQDPEPTRQALEIVAREGFWTGEIEQRTKSGKTITVEARWQIIRDANGKPTGVFGVNRDITDAIVEREQRARHQRMESIGTLASGMAHDLNNVLTPVLLTLEVLERDQSDPAKRKLIRTMEASVKRGAEMIRQVLSYARGVDGEREVLNLGALMEEVLHLTRETLPRNIEVKVHFDSPLWAVSGDATQLMQVVVNLIINARDAMPNGGVLEVSARNGYGADAGRIAIDLEGEQFVYVDVIDTGVGIEPGALSRIFEPFYTTKPVGAGTGLGLSTSQAIVKSHGGRLEVTSTLGRGTRFTLILRAVPEAMVADDAKSNVDVADVSRTGSGARVLVVDDEPNIVAMFQEILRLEGYEVDGANDGAEALAIVEAAARDYDVIVTDLNMPKLSGEDLARKIAQRGRKTRFVFVSGLNASPQVRNETLFRESMFLQKPFQSAALLDAVEATLRDA